MPKAQSVAFCEQTHPECRGHACDDHIHMDCHVVETSERLQNLIKKHDEIYQKKISALCDEWLKNHPEESECLCEGEEFVGTTWLTTSAPHERTGQICGFTDHDEICERIQRLIDQG